MNIFSNRMEARVLLIGLVISSGIALRVDQAVADTELGPGPGSYRINSPDGSVCIPFEMFRDDIRMLGMVNGQPVRMFLDNGHLWDDLLFFGSARVDSLGIQPEGEIEVGSGNEGDPVPAVTAQDLKISFPDIEFFGQGAVIIGYEPGQPNLWEGAEGQVSAAFLKHFVVGIDFEEGVITLTPPNQFQYTGAGVELPLIPLPDQAWAILGSVELAGGRVISTDLMMDLGTGDALCILTDGPHSVSPPDKAIAATLGYTVAGPMLGHFGRVRGITLGGYRLAEPLTTFDASGCTEAYTEIMLGMETFRRFHVTFDYPHRRLFLEPNKFFSDPTEFDMSGLFLEPTRTGDWRVSRVLPDSPGSDQRLAPGDVITSIEGHPSSDFKFWDLMSLMRREDSQVHLHVRRNSGPDFDVVLVLRRLL